MQPLKAFLLGAAAIGLVGYALVAALTVAARAGGGTFEFAIGPLVVAAVARVDETTVTTFGPGLVIVAFVGGIVNLAAALFVRRRACGAVESVE